MDVSTHVSQNGKKISSDDLKEDWLKNGIRACQEVYNLDNLPIKFTELPSGTLSSEKLKAHSQLLSMISKLSLEAKEFDDINEDNTGGLEEKKKKRGQLITTLIKQMISKSENCNVTVDIKAEAVLRRRSIRKMRQYSIPNILKRKESLIHCSKEVRLGEQIRMSRENMQQIATMVNTKELPEKAFCKCIEKNCDTVTSLNEGPEPIFHGHYFYFVESEERDVPDIEILKMQSLIRDNGGTVLDGKFDDQDQCIYLAGKDEKQNQLVSKWLNSANKQENLYKWTLVDHCVLKKVNPDWFYDRSEFSEYIWRPQESKQETKPNAGIDYPFQTGTSRIWQSCLHDSEIRNNEPSDDSACFMIDRKGVQTNRRQAQKRHFATDFPDNVNDVSENSKKSFLTFSESFEMMEKGVKQEYPATVTATDKTFRVEPQGQLITYSKFDLVTYARKLKISEEQDKIKQRICLIDEESKKVTIKKPKKRWIQLMENSGDEYPKQVLETNIDEVVGIQYQLNPRNANDNGRAIQIDLLCSDKPQNEFASQNVVDLENNVDLHLIAAQSGVLKKYEPDIKCESEILCGSDIKGNLDTKCEQKEVSSVDEHNGNIFDGENELAEDESPFLISEINEVKASKRGKKADMIYNTGIRFEMFRQSLKSDRPSHLFQLVTEMRDLKKNVAANHFKREFIEKTKQDVEAYYDYFITNQETFFNTDTYLMKEKEELNKKNEGIQKMKLSAVHKAKLLDLLKRPWAKAEAKSRQQSEDN